MWYQFMLTVVLYIKAILPETLGYSCLCFMLRWKCYS